MTDPMTTTRAGDVLTDAQLPSPKIINEYIRQMEWDLEQDYQDGQRETTVLTHRLSDVLASHRALQQRLDAAEAGAASTAVYMVWTAEYAEVAYFLTKEAACHFIDNDLFIIRNTMEEGYGHNEKYPWQVRSILEDDEYQIFATREEAEAWLETNTPRSLANINWGELHAPGVNDLKQRLDAAEQRAERYREALIECAEAGADRDPAEANRIAIAALTEQETTDA